MNILQIHSSARAEGSHSTRLVRQIVERLQASLPDPAQAAITVRDLGRTPHPELNEATLQALFTPPEQRTPAQAERVALDDALIAELQAADVVVLGVPMYNFGVPAPLKNWIDAISRAKVTFQYTANGPKGLLKGKKVVHRAHARRPIPQHARRHAGALPEDGVVVPRHERHPACLCRRPRDGPRGRATGARLGAVADRGPGDRGARRGVRSQQR